MTNSIAEASTALNQMQVQQQVGMNVLRADMDASQAQADSIAEMAGDNAELQNQVVQDPTLGQQVNLMA